MLVAGISGDCARADVARQDSANATTKNRTIKTLGYIRSDGRANLESVEGARKARRQRLERHHCESSSCIAIFIR